jgi:oligopeptide transport system substrate-binding protein
MSSRPFLALAALLLLGLSLTACGAQRPHRAPCPARQRCLEYGNTADPTTLDPQLAETTNESAILRELFDGLFTDAPDGNPTPALARSTQVSPDGLVWTFHLRPSRWSDGAPVTANDFVYAYRRMLDPKTGSAYAYLLYVLKNGRAVNDGKAPPEALGVRALDDETLQLTLEHPASYLPQLLKHQAFYPIPAHLVSRVGAKWSDPGRMVSNGPYRLVAWRLGDYVRIEKNPSFQGVGRLCFDRVDFYPTTDTVAAERRVLRGELDINDLIQDDRLPRLLRNPISAAYVRSHPFLETTYIAFNTRDVTALKDVRVRQAISMAIDRDFITRKLLRAGERPTSAFVPLDIAGYLPVGAPHPHPYWADWSLERRQAEARRLLAEAGYPPNRRLKLELKTTNRPGSLIYIQAIQNDLKSVGVDVSFRQEDGMIVYQSYNLRDFQLGAAGWVADFNDPMTFLGLLKSDTGAQNYGDYRNPAYDALLAAADNEPDAGKRAANLAKAEQMILDAADLAPLFNDVTLNLVDPHITGWVDNASGIHPIRNLCPSDAGIGKPAS